MDITGFDKELLTGLTIFLTDNLCVKLTTWSKDKIIRLLTERKTYFQNDLDLMSVIVTTRQHTSTPFYNGAKEIQDAYARLYGFDYKKACCTQNDFDFVKLD